MPAGFDKCKSNGGAIRTVSGPDKKYGLQKGEYVHVCILKGEFHRGDVKVKEPVKK